MVTATPTLTIRKGPALVGAGRWVHPIWVGATVVGALMLAVVAATAVRWDLMAYHQLDVADPYARTTGLAEQFAFMYSPPMILLFAPLTWLPFPVLAAVWLALQVAALWYIAGRWALALVILPPVWLDLTYGNIAILFAAMIVAARRHPWVWSFGLLTKVTPGIGVLWHVARGEWRAVMACAVLTGAAVALSLVVLGPEPWADWFAFLRAGAAMPAPFDALAVPLLPRLAVAAAIIVYGARNDRYWLVPIAVVVAMPVLWVISFTPLIALVRPEHPEQDRRAVGDRIE